MTAHNPFKYFKTSPEIIRLAVMYYIRYPLSFRQVKDILHERGVDICHETVRFWVERFGSKFAGEILKNKAGHHSNWQWGAVRRIRTGLRLLRNAGTYAEHS